MIIVAELLDAMLIEDVERSALFALRQELREKLTAPLKAAVDSSLGISDKVTVWGKKAEAVIAELSTMKEAVSRADGVAAALLGYKDLETGIPPSSPFRHLFFLITALALSKQKVARQLAKGQLDHQHLAKELSPEDFKEEALSKAEADLKNADDRIASIQMVTVQLTYPHSTPLSFTPPPQPPPLSPHHSLSS